MNTNNKIYIRQETPEDFKGVKHLLYEAFKKENPTPTEPILVENLRKSDCFIPELSLVAEQNNTIIGYILLTKIKIGNHVKSLALAPVAILPEYQRQGIGKKLIKEAHSKARELNYDSIIVLGHKEYYPLLGYKPLSNYKIKLPFKGIAEEYCMVMELIPSALEKVHGTVEYAKPFMENL